MAFDISHFLSRAPKEPKPQKALSGCNASNTRSIAATSPEREEAVVKGIMNGRPRCGRHSPLPVHVFLPFPKAVTTLPFRSDPEEVSMEDLGQALRRCLHRFRDGTLAEGDLRAAIDARERPRMQGLLYIQAPTTNPHSRAIGMSIFEEGKNPDGVDSSGAFLYATIRDALVDG